MDGGSHGRRLFRESSWKLSGKYSTSSSGTQTRKSPGVRPRTSAATDATRTHSGSVNSGTSPARRGWSKWTWGSEKSSDHPARSIASASTARQNSAFLSTHAFLQRLKGHCRTLTQASFASRGQCGIGDARVVADQLLANTPAAKPAEWFCLSSAERRNV